MRMQCCDVLCCAGNSTGIVCGHTCMVASTLDPAARVHRDRVTWTMLDMVDVMKMISMVDEFPHMMRPHAQMPWAGLLWLRSCHTPEAHALCSECVTSWRLHGHGPCQCSCRRVIFASVAAAGSSDFRICRFQTEDFLESEWRVCQDDQLVLNMACGQ